MKENDIGYINLSCTENHILLTGSGYAIIKVIVHGYRRFVPLIGKLLEMQFASTTIVKGN